jgi:hypothetical protein
MRAHEAALAAELAGRHGVTSVDRLDALGIGKRSVHALVRQGRLIRAGNGVLVSNCWPPDLGHRMAVACAIAGGIVAFPTAGLAWRLRKSPRWPEISTCVPAGRRVSEPPGVRVRRIRHLPESDIVRRPDGIAIMSPPRTAADAAHVLDAEDLESLVEHGIDLGYFTSATFRRVAEPLCGRGRPGSNVLRTVLSVRDRSARPARSDHELRLERAMRRRGFPELVREPRLMLTSASLRTGVDRLAADSVEAQVPVRYLKLHKSVRHSGWAAGAPERRWRALVESGS